MEKVDQDKKDGTLLVSCTYDEKEYGPIARKVQINLCSNVTIKGFRKGKAPIDMAINYVKPEDIYNKMIDKLIKKDFATLLEGYEGSKDVSSINPGLSVNFDDKKKTYTLSYLFYFLPKAEIKADKGLKVEAKEKEVTEKDIDDKLQKLLVDNAELVPSTDAAAELNDHVIIDFTGFIDGKEFEGGSAKDYELTLGSHSFVPGFEEGLVGVKANDKKSLEITFPANYLPSLANKKAKFNVVVHTVKKVVKPELNDEFATTVESYEAKDLADLKNKIKDELVKQNKSAFENEKFAKAMEAIRKDAKFTISNHYVEVVANSIQENQLNQVKQYGLDLNSYLKVSGISLEQFKKSCADQARVQAENFAIIRTVSEKENLAVTDEDVVNYFGGKEKYDSLMELVKKQASNNPNFSLDGYLANIKEELLDKKVRDFLIANN